MKSPKPILVIRPSQQELDAWGSEIDSILQSTKNLQGDYYVIIASKDVDFEIHKWDGENHIITKPKEMDRKELKP